MAPTERSAHDVTIPARPGFAVWLFAWTLGVVLSGIVLVAVGRSSGESATVPQMAALLATTWAVFGVALWFASQRIGSSDFVADYGVQIRPVDLAGIPAGIAAQLLAIPLLYIPLRSLWPQTFSDDAVSERANEIVDAASGPSVVLLGFLLVIGAPVFEELVYRGLLQRSLGSSVGRWTALVLTAALFAIVHFSPVEIPGLFVAALVFGLGVVLTGRIGFGLFAHMAFNFVALITLI